MPECPEGLVEGFGAPAGISNAICATRSYFGLDDDAFDVYVSGTGYLIATSGGSSKVLTAAHNLYHPSLQRRVVSMKFFFGRSGGTTAAIRDLGAAHYPDEYTQSFAPPEWDFGVASVAPLGAGTFRPIPLAGSTAVGETEKLLVGYPDEGDCKDAFAPYHASFTVYPSSSSNYGYRDQPTYVGMSGGPLLARHAEEIVSYGIHIRGAPNVDRGVRFSAAILDRIRGWTG